MNFTFPNVTLLSTPTEKSIPLHQAQGSIFISRGHFTFATNGHTRQPVNFSITSIAKKQQTKDSAKVRILLADGGAYVFSFQTIDTKDSVISALNTSVDNTNITNITSSTTTTSSLLSSTSILPDNVEKDSQRHVDSLSESKTRISVTSDRSLGNEEEVRTMKTEIRKRDIELNAKYIELVLGKVVSDDEFWNAPRNRAALVDEFLRHSKKGWDSVMVDDLRPMEQSAGKTTFMVDRAFKDSTFGREPKIREAYTEYVPSRMAEIDFWRRYIAAKQARKKLEAETEATGDIQSNHGRSRTSAGALRQLGGTTIDARSIAPEQFFDLFQRGIIDVGGVGSNTGSGGRLQKRQSYNKKSDIGEIDPTIDLLATEEDSVRGRTHEERAGYGLGAREADENGIPPGEEAQMSLLMASGGSGSGGGGERGATNSNRWAEIEAVRKRRREASQTIDSVNDHSTRVLASSKTAIRTEKKDFMRKKIRPMDASTADDLPDLYSEQRTESDELNTLVELNATSETFRTALSIQTDAEISTAPVESIQSGWSIVEGENDEVLPLDTPMLQDSFFTAGSTSVVKTKITPPLKDTALPVFQSSLESFRKGVKQARTVVLDVTRKANDLFYAQSRSKTGFSDKVPSAWQAYIIARYRNNNELMLHLWKILSSLSSLTDIIQDDERKTNLERGRRVLSAIEAQHDEIERLKREVEKKGVFFNPPNIANIGTQVLGVSLNNDDAEKAKSEVISVLILLQLYMEKSIDRARKVI
jgi:hypothetical protein